MPLVVFLQGCLKIKNLGLYIHKHENSVMQKTTNHYCQRYNLILDRLGQNSENETFKSHNLFQIVKPPICIKGEDHDLRPWTLLFFHIFAIAPVESETENDLSSSHTKRVFNAFQ